MKLKLVYSFALSIILGIFWLVTVVITDHQILGLETSGKISYGPQPLVDVDYYSYSSVKKAFDPQLNLSTIELLSKDEFEKIILESLPLQAQNNFKEFIKDTLALSVDYQIDPLWIISVMMVESGFELNVVSDKNAQGLMQIQPETAEHLLKLMGKPNSLSSFSNNNVDIGIFYLKKLYQNFRQNYEFATLAYNIGPNKLKKYIKNKKDLTNFSYLVKVQECYKLIENNLLLQLKDIPRSTSENLADIPYRDNYFTDYPVQSKIFL